MQFENKTRQVDLLNQKVQALGPVPQQALKQIQEFFRIGLTYSSNAIEGNTLTETETKVLLEDGLTVAGKPLRDHLEAAGHSEAFDFVLELARKKTISERDILKIHRLFYFRIDEKNAGKYRDIAVTITGTPYLPPSALKVPALMKRFVARMPAMRRELHPLVFAAKLHSGLVDIHPFVDGNGRTARLLMNLALLQAGYCPTVVPPVLRAEYIAAIRLAQTGKKDDTQFIRLISCMAYESTKDYLRLLKHLVKT